MIPVVAKAYLSSLRSMLGLEDERTVFARYQAIRRAERDYLSDRTDVAAGTLRWPAEFKTGIDPR